MSPNSTLVQSACSCGSLLIHDANHHAMRIQFITLYFENVTWLGAEGFGYDFSQGLDVEAVQLAALPRAFSRIRRMYVDLARWPRFLSSRRMIDCGSEMLTGRL